MDGDYKLIICLIVGALTLFAFGVYTESNNRNVKIKLVAESCKTMNLAIKINDRGNAECFKP